MQQQKHTQTSLYLKGVIITSLISVGLVTLFWLGWTHWFVALLILVTWLPLFLIKTTSIARTSSAHALLFVFLVTQGLHLIEHCAQMIQIHILGFAGIQAHGIFGMLDLEWVHFLWNSWTLVFGIALLFAFRKNRWLWILLPVALWHEAEHVWIMSVYFRTGLVGTPGLLAKGGAIEVVPLSRPDLHFCYVLIETVLIFASFLSAQPLLHRQTTNDIKSPTSEVPAIT